MSSAFVVNAWRLAKDAVEQVTSVGRDDAVGFRPRCCCLEASKGDYR